MTWNYVANHFKLVPISRTETSCKSRASTGYSTLYLPGMVMLTGARTIILCETPHGMVSARVSGTHAIGSSHIIVLLSACVQCSVAL